jgi:hypothetical protein
MKFFLALTVIGISLGIASGAQSGTPLAEIPQATPAAQNDASQLGAPAVSAETATNDRTQHLRRQADEINQTLSEKQTNSTDLVQEMLDLPQGLVIRPTRRGLMVGTQF